MYLLILAMLYTSFSMVCVTPATLRILNYGIREIRIKDVISFIVFLPGTIVLFIIAGVVYLCTSGILDKKVFNQNSEKGDSMQ